jgi:hypothetical protein
VSLPIMIAYLILVAGVLMDNL